MYKVLTFNNISVAGLERLPRDRYEIASEIQHPDAVLLRSHKLHNWPVPDTLLAIGRAGAGVNNIPVEDMNKRGIVVFNAPGANANAVKELVLAGMFLAARNICPAWDYVRQIKASPEEMEQQVEAGKKRFAGFELPGRTLGVIGLGNIGVRVANAAEALGMRVIGYDPNITVNNAWQLSAQVEQIMSVGELLSQADFVTVHVPMLDATRHLINAERLAKAKSGLTLLNFARAGIIDEQAALAALNANQLHAYVCDFPSPALQGHQKVIALPHLGASTKEAEDNCAMMVADQIRDYLEHGTVKNSVNFPEMDVPRIENACRIFVVNANVPHMLERITTAIARLDINILDLLNRSRGEIACTIIDVPCPPPPEVVEEIGNIKGVLRIRTL